MQSQPIAFDAVLIVEDEAVARDRLLRLTRDLAGAQARIDAVADVSAAHESLQCGDYAVVLVDVKLPDGNGVELVDWIARRWPERPSVIVTAYAEEEIILAAVRAGAIGYLLKDSDDDELRLSLKNLQRGGAPINPLIARRILALLSAASPPPVRASEPVPRLSERECEILRLVAQGFSNREIANLVALSRLTVECHTKNIYRKLAVGSRTEAVFEARTLGLLR